MDGKRLRQVAGAFPTGVTVVTTESETDEVYGMTASSFLSVSLDPALVSFCVKEDATLFTLLEVGKVVGISILAAHQKEISNQFAGINKEEIVVPMFQVTQGVHIVEGALAWYSTKITQIVPAGDHFLILCEIVDLDRAEEGLPLVYWSGYRTTGEAV
ncbi:MAG: flavin reductase family protein [Bacteroidota bacterium]